MVISLQLDPAPRRHPHAQPLLVLLDAAALTCLAATSLGVWAVFLLLVWSWFGAPPVGIGGIAKLTCCMLAATMGLAAVAGEIRNRR